ncbi:Protein turtle like protein [Argiope bruennichi]|uniref:Protein turtle like protein n=1 Tax=Argiope bruennichi TaxID=94029 RepID=A0A8T0G2F7_ARGBR|nr:Protein turtle like protein [Argiope bruennichi]
MILKKTCQLLALFVCIRVTKGCTPKNDQNPRHFTATLGEDVILCCDFEYPEEKPVPYVIQWQKQGIKIPIYIWYDGYPPHAGDGYEGRVSLAEKASLNLTNVHESDQGWYECKVYFLNRPPDSPKNGTWVHLDVHAPPHFKMKPPDVVYVKVGESVSLPCEAEGTPPPNLIWYKVSPATIVTPPRNVTKLEGDRAEFICEAKALPSNVTHRWFHNGVEISQLSWLETRTSVRRDGTLFISPTSAEDSGKFTCEVTNGIGTPDTASAYLSVEYPARVTFSPTIQYLPLGLSGVIRCYVQASPPFQFITWTKESRQYDPNSIPGVVTLNNGSLLFQRVTHEDQGRYRCTPYNIHGTAGTSNIMDVLVREPPIYTLKPKEIYQKPVDSEIRLPCDGLGQPKPAITWRRADGSKLPRDRAMIRGGNLTIKGLKKEDHGRYECVLENEIATLVTSTLLLVERTTPHAPTNVTVNTSTVAATLTWLPAYDGGHEQTYVIWYRLADQGDSDWRTIRVYPDGATTFTVYNLQADTEYDFQVLSRNKLGDGMFSPIIRAKTKFPAEPPTPPKPAPGPVRNVTVTKTLLGVRITWNPPADTVPVSHYMIDYKNDPQWQHWGPIKNVTHFEAKLLQGGKYVFRIIAYSNEGVAGTPSNEVKLEIHAYMMVTCPIADARNGGHSHGGSPVPLKNN